MWPWFSQNRKQIVFWILFCIFIVQVLVVPSIRPFFYEGRNYYITYRIDGNNIADAVVWIPLSFMAMGFFCTLLSCSKKMTIALACALVPLPVVVLRRARWMAYFSVLDNALYNLCMFAVGILLAVFLQKIVTVTIRTVRTSWRRYLEKKSGHRDAADSYSDTPHKTKSSISDLVRRWITRDHTVSLLSVAVPFLIFFMYRVIADRTDSISIALDSMYMVFGLPLGYVLCGLLCGAARKPYFFECCAAVILLSLDTVWEVYAFKTETLYRLPIIMICYLAVFGIGLAFAYFLRYCIRFHLKKHRREL